MPALPTRIHVGWSETITGIARQQCSTLLPADAPVHSLVPAPLSRDVAPVPELRNAWREQGIRTSLLLPRPALTSVLSRDHSLWETVTAGTMRLRIDRRLTCKPYVAILVLTHRMRHGPFVLDLPSHFLHPTDRLRLAARPDRLRVQADITAAALPSSSLLITPLGNGLLWIATSDPLAAELWSLAMAERWLGDDVEMQGPWEDPSVQRATELQVGVRIPSDMAIDTVDYERLPPKARDLLLEKSGRLGMPSPSRMR